MSQIEDSVIPYDLHTKENGRCKLDVKDGLLEFATEIPFLKTDYESIFTQNYDFLSKVKEIRNKFEHKMHGAELISIGRGNMIIFNLSYKIKAKDQWIILYAGEFLKFTKQINELFSKLQNQVASFPHQQDQTMDPYYRRLIRYDFRDFNQIYDSPLLKIVGKTLVQF